MKIIPIKFEHHGKEYAGRFTHTQPDTSIWYLTDNKNSHLGKLRRHNDSWIFDDSDPENKLSELADYFANYIIAWIE